MAELYRERAPGVEGRPGGRRLSLLVQIVKDVAFRSRDGHHCSEYRAR